MRIAVVCPGDSLHSLPWVHELLARGHEVVVYAYPPITQAFEPARVAAVEGANPIARARWLRRRVRDDKPDAVVQQYVATDAYALSHMGKPLVLGVWGSDILRDLSHPLKRAMVARALRSATLVVSPGKHVTARLCELGVETSRITTMQYGVDTRAFSPLDGVDEPPVRVVCTRSLRPVYGNEDILDALALTTPDLIREVVFTGRGSLLPDLMTRAKELGVGDRSRFLDGVSSMEEALHQADIYCSMSRSDGASLSLLEAMSCGLPVVVSDIPASREWISDGVNGFLVPCAEPEVLAERLSRAAQDAELRRALGQAARQTVLEYGDREKNLRAIIDSVEDAIGQA